MALVAVGRGVRNGRRVVVVLMVRNFFARRSTLERGPASARVGDLRGFEVRGLVGSSTPNPNPNPFMKPMFCEEGDTQVQGSLNLLAV